MAGNHQCCGGATAPPLTDQVLGGGANPSARSIWRQPRGNTAPRWARSPLNSFSSPQVNVFCFSPDHSTSVPCGGTTATAVSTSSREAAFLEGISNSLLPLPFGISGTSLTLKPNILPSLLITNTSEYVEGTNAGASTCEFSGTLSTVLPARRSVINSLRRTVNPYPAS